MKIRSVITSAFMAMVLWQNAAFASSIEVDNAYARETPPNAPASAAFMSITNHNAVTVKLIRAESNAAEFVELHTHSNDNGIMRMRKVNAIEIPSHTKVTLQPGGLHIMMINPQIDFKSGAEVKMKLVFSNGDSKTLTVPVKSMREMMQQSDNAHNHEHSMEHHQH